MSRFQDIHIPVKVVARLKRGERAAQEKVYRAYVTVVHGLATRILKDSSLAREVTQDTFIDMIEKVGALRNAESLGAWIRSICVNHCLMRLRSPWMARRESLDVMVEQPLVDNDRFEGLEDLETAMEQLPEDTRMVLWLHEVEGYTHTEIGQLFGHTASFSKSRLVRGYEKLRTWLETSNENETRAVGSDCLS